ncbi:MAG: hypothetical protein QXQ38_07595 [Archaeoglobaceae archaeon]|nr:hypothetical protein [Archaeoglobales archaeon]MDI9642140.1 hypothetical protein [Archaeoglobales archaeon]
MSKQAVQALSGLATFLVFLAIFSPLWIVEGPFWIKIEPKISYLDILMNLRSLPTPFSDPKTPGEVALGLALLVISAFFAISSAIVSAFSTASGRATSLAIVSTWGALATLYASTEIISGSTPELKFLTSTVVEIHMGSAFVLMILAGVLLIMAWFFEGRIIEEQA